jgi:phage repressor protein C with HTH and peptisase S24 domain
MLPTIVGGDVVFADTRHRVPSPPGIYVLADQFGGVVVKRLEVISRPSEDPVQVRIISDNPRHSPQELTLDEINIIGKYVGRFTV